MITIDQTDSLLNDSDHSLSLSPTPPTPVETSLDYYPTGPLSPGAMDRGSLAAALNDQGLPSDELSESCGDSSSTSSRQQHNADSVSNGRGHNRNNSVDEVLLKMRSTGLAFSDMDDRPSTLSRLHKGRVDKPRAGFLSVLVAVGHVIRCGSHVTVWCRGVRTCCLRVREVVLRVSGAGRRGKSHETACSWSVAHQVRTHSLCVCVCVCVCVTHTLCVCGGGAVGADKEKKARAAAVSGSHKRQRSWGGNKEGESAGMDSVGE